MPQGRTRARWLPLLACSLLSIAIAGAIGSGASLGAVSQGGMVDWPPSQDLLIGELVTGATSANDEYVEIYNAGSVPADLGGLELVYATSTGSSVTSKVTWASSVLAPGRHVLLANSAGVYAGLADDLYSGGLAATGGALALRIVGGTVLDAIGWGSAASGFVEGNAAPAPPAGQSLERLPGGSEGNGWDTNNNLADTWVQPLPIPESLAAPPVPLPTPSPGDSVSPWPSIVPSTGFPSPTPAPSGLPSMTASPSVAATAVLTSEPTAQPTSDPTPTVIATLTPTPTPTPVPTSTVAPTATAGRTPTETPAPTDISALTIASARQLPLDATVTVEGVITVLPGRILGDRVIAIQDQTAGICVRLPDDIDPTGLLPGRLLRASGRLAAPYANLELRVANGGGLILGPTGEMPEAQNIDSSALAEPLEGQLARLAGTLTRAETSGGAVALTLTDAGGDARVFLDVALGASKSSYTLGATYAAKGIVGQRESASGANDGYRLWPRDVTDVVLMAPAPTLSVTPTPTALPTDTLAPSSTPTRLATPAPPEPTATTSLTSIAATRGLPVGASAWISGTVTVAPGRIVDDRVLAVQDSTGGICVRIPAGVELSGLTEGTILRVRGTLAAPYGNLELRPAAAMDLTALGTAPVPGPMTGTTASLDESNEGRLLRLAGTLTRVETGSSGSLALVLTGADDSSEARIFLFASIGADRADYALGARYAISGIVGQRESASGLNDGYRLWPRGRDDVMLLAPPPSPKPSPPTSTPRPTAPRPSPTARPRSTPTPRPTETPVSVPQVPITTALKRAGQRVSVTGITTSRSGLLDSDGRRITIQDASAAILLRLPSGASAPAVGTRLRVTGTVGTYFGAPQLEAESPPTLLQHGTAAPILLHRVPTAHDEWELVRLTAQIINVSKNGAAWRAEVSLGAGGQMPVVGLAASGIPSGALVEGRNAMLTGIVKRAYSTASDQRFALVLRSTADLQLGAEPRDTLGPGYVSPTSGDRTPGSRSFAAGAYGPPGDSAMPSGQLAVGDDSIVSTTIDDLGSLLGQRVRVGGRVTSVDGPMATLADGTGEATLRFLSTEDATAVALVAGELVNVVGWDAERDLGGLEVVVTAASDVSRAPGLDAGSGGSPEPGGISQPSDAPLPVGGMDGSVANPGGTDPGVGIAAGLAAALAAAAVMLAAGPRVYLRRRRPAPAALPPAASVNAAEPGGPSGTGAAGPATFAGSSEGDGPATHS